MVFGSHCFMSLSNWANLVVIQYNMPGHVYRYPVLQSCPAWTVMPNIRAWILLMKKSLVKAVWVQEICYLPSLKRRYLPLFSNVDVPLTSSASPLWSSWTTTFLIQSTLSLKIWYWSMSWCGCYLATASNEGEGFLEPLPLLHCFCGGLNLSQVDLSWLEICGLRHVTMSVCCWRSVGKDFEHHFCKLTLFEKLWSSISTGNR